MCYKYMKFYVLYIFLYGNCCTHVYTVYVCVYVCVCNEKKSSINKFIHCLTKNYVYQLIGVKLDITFVTFLHYERCQKE